MEWKQKVEEKEKELKTNEKYTEWRWKQNNSKERKQIYEKGKFTMNKRSKGNACGILWKCK